MATSLPITNGVNGHGNGDTVANASTNGDSQSQLSVKAGLARMLKGGVIMDVVNAEQVHIATPLLH